MYNSEGCSIKGGTVYNSLAIIRDHHILRHVWPAVIQAQHSEKPAVQLIVDKIIKRVEKSFETVNFLHPVCPLLPDAPTLAPEYNVVSLCLIYYNIALVFINVGDGTVTHPAGNLHRSISVIQFA